jgi:hypothetical protein
MSTIEIDEAFNRRRFLGTAAMTLAAAQLGRADPVAAQIGHAASPKLPAIKRGSNTSFKALKQINAGLLNIGYAEDGPADGPPVILLTHAPPAVYRARFSGKYEHRDIAGGVGHNLPQEAPEAFAQAVVDVDKA